MSSPAIYHLIAGYKRFRTNPERCQQLAHLAEGQAPKVMVIACADSRVDPAIVLDCDPGDIFMVRNVANLVPPYATDARHHGTCAALEFAVLGLGIEHIIVFGHAGCGGIRALVGQQGSAKRFEFIEDWMAVAAPAKHKVQAEHPYCSVAEQAKQCEKAGVLTSLDNLMTFPWIADRVQQHKITLHGWYLNLAEQAVEAYSAESDCFQPL